MATATSKGTALVELPTNTQIRITREFNAPRHLVYRAWTTPELIKRWWHANRGKVTVAEVDLRVGGSWRWVLLTHEGFEVAFHGLYREIVPNERLVHTEVFEGAPNAKDDEGTLNWTTLTEVNGRTTVTTLVEAGTQAVRDAILDSGMEAGMQDAMDLLEQVAISLL